ncbi:MAG TPA: UDP-N-acetylmuramate dehydrogenase [Patescibacteria group bacterium]|nr:UDP-N-acetylmuramate dehydrogenase [Patescibacteria group bacterium]
MKLYSDFKISDILYYRIGGLVKYLYDVENKDDIKKVFELLKREKITKTFFLGTGSNLIFTDEYFDGAVIRFVPGKIRLLKPHIIEADAGVVLDDLVKFALNNNLVGLEWAGGLPGDVGAAIRGNVGAFGGEIKDSVKEVEIFEVINGKPKFKVLKRFELKFSYRNSLVKMKKLGVISAQFRLTKVDDATVLKARQTYVNNMEYRRVRHPLEYPNCGSVFKNISDPEHTQSIIEVFPDLEDKIKRDWYGKVAMGYLIKRLNFSEYRVGNAMVSSKHGNFIVNLGGAKATDVLSIIKAIQEKFVETFNFTPEVEVEIVS